MNAYDEILFMRKKVEQETASRQILTVMGQPTGAPVKNTPIVRPRGTRNRPIWRKKPRAMGDDMGPTYEELGVPTVNETPWYENLLNTATSAAGAIIKAKTSGVVARDAAAMRAAGYPIPSSMAPYAGSMTSGLSMSTLLVLGAVAVGGYLLMRK